MLSLKNLLDAKDFTVSPETAWEGDWWHAMLIIIIIGAELNRVKAEKEPRSQGAKPCKLFADHDLLSPSSKSLFPSPRLDHFLLYYSTHSVGTLLVLAFPKHSLVIVGL